MEIIRIAGYTEDEKVEIARKHLIPHAITKDGLDSKEWLIDDEALLTIIRRYTREAGVRNLERELSTLIRKAVKELIMSKNKLVKASADKPRGLSRRAEVPLRRARGPGPGRHRI
jgi:ATP-dependent Lon protease